MRIKSSAVCTHSDDLNFVLFIYFKLWLRRPAQLLSIPPLEYLNVHIIHSQIIHDLQNCCCRTTSLEKCRLATCEPSACFALPPAATAAAVVKYQKYMRSPGEISFRSFGSPLVVNLQKRPNLTLS